MKSTLFYAERVLSLLAAVILLQTLYYKFTAHPDSVYIFTQLGAEPFGRIFTGVLELFTGFLLLFRKSSIYGAIVGLGIISGAILSHFIVLGIEVQNDGGKLFLLAILVFFACLGSILTQWSKFKAFLPFQMRLSQ